MIIRADDGPWRPVPRLRGLATAVPPHVLRQQDVAAAAERMFAASYADFDRMRAIFAHAEIDTRHSCVPLDWYAEPHGQGERNDLYLANAVDLIQQAATDALEAAGTAADAVDTLIVVSSTGIATPSLDARLIERMPFRRDVTRVPVFGLGCAGGVLGLGHAAEMARAAPNSTVLLLVVELCGLTFLRGDHSKSNVVATALFGDGAAGAVVSCSGNGPALTASGSHTWPGSLDVMGWNVGDEGLQVVFSRDIPTIVRTRLGEAVDGFLASNGLNRGDIDRIVPHPGGAKVIAALERTFDLAPGALDDAREVLRRYGNMSAASVLFVLERALSGPAGRILMTSLGPGFTAGFQVLDA
jgi:alkylresorcinol/alkylpyrone synthase